MSVVVTIVGPTAIGKTRLSVELAKILPLEIVSADSRQIYRFLDIATAKPPRDVLDKIPHHLIDFLRPDEYFSAGRYSQVGRKVIEQIFKRHRVPVIVGGSGLYIQALLDGLSNVEIRDEKIRQSLRHRMAVEGIEKLYLQLLEIDPVLATRIPKNDKQRIIRGLEVYLKTGKRLSEVQEVEMKPADFTALIYGLNGAREWLYQKINRRVEEMLHQGLLAEAANLKFKGYGLHLNALNTVGYKEVFNYLDNKIDYDTMIELIKQNTRKYAKRQLTWFRKDKRISWIEVGETSDFAKIAQEIAGIYNNCTKSHKVTQRK